MMELRTARAEEQATVRSLLTAAGLPVEDLDDATVDVIVAIQDDVLVGAIGLESFGDDGLLRSLVVSPDARGGGIGRHLVDAIEAHASAAGFDSLVLLTTTAAPFFAARGYQVINRTDAPVAVQASAEFRSLCPASATCMRKSLESTA